MAKTKNKRVIGLSDQLHTKKAKNKVKKTLNPFEVHINKEKFKILGKKTKNERGLPGVSRARAIKKRKNTLGYELKLVNKSNTFLDKRIGEKNVALTEEEKIMARFAAEKIHQHKAKTGKQSIYNLAEDEILTHRGQTLEEIEKFDDPRSDDEDDDMEAGKFGHLREKFVSDANFGGGVLSRSENTDGAKSRKDLIEQLILESKKRKLEKQKLKEETLDLTEKLDTEWKDLHPMVSSSFNRESEKTEKPTKEPVSLIDKLLSANEKKDEDYDKTMRELKFEPRGTPSDRLKSEDEIAKIEKEKLEKLEKDRLARMHGVATIEKVQTTAKHRSADDLDDGYEIDSDPEIVIAYDKEGKLLVPLTDTNTEEKNENEEENESDDGDEDENEGEESDDSNDSLDDLRIVDKSSDEDDNNDIEMENKEIETVKPEEKEIVPSKKAKKSVSFSLETSEPKTTNVEVKSILKNPIESAKKDDPVKEKVECQDPEKIKKDLLARKEMMEKASQELPYTYEMPKSYEELTDLLMAQQPEYQFTIVERIIKCNHPSLGEGNKKKLATFFAYMLQFLNDSFSEELLENETDIKTMFKTFDQLLTHYYLLAQMDPENTKSCILEVLKEKYEDYKRHPKIIPDLDTLIFFKLVSALFSTSDLKHPVVTPCFHFISQILSNMKPRNSIDLTRGLFLVVIILEYTALSKRFLPAAINFIRGVLSLYVPSSAHGKISVVPPFRLNSNMSKIVSIDKPTTCTVSTDNMVAKYLLIEDIGDEYKVRTLLTTLKLFNALFKQTEHLNIQKSLFEPHYKIICEIEKNKYPTIVSQLIDRIKNDVEETFKKKTMKPLVEESKPVQIKFYEPAIEDVFSGKRKRVMSKEKLEHQKLVYRHKKEMKGALREIRRDRTFIGSVKIKDKIRSDNIRKAKVKQIYSEASLQQGELNALTRSKKKKK